MNNKSEKQLIQDEIDDYYRISQQQGQEQTWSDDNILVRLIKAYYMAALVGSWVSFVVVFIFEGIRLVVS